MKQSLKITQYIMEILNDNDDLVEYVGTRLFPIDAKQGTSYPFIVVNRTGVQASYSKDGNAYDLVNVSISIAEPKYETCVDIAQLVRESLDGKSFSNDEIWIKQIHLINCYESIQFDAVVQELQFEVKI